MARVDPKSLSTLEEVRAGIDAIDDEIMVLLGERMRHVDCVVPLKARDGIAAAAPGRVAAVYEKTRARAARAGVDPAMAEGMWRVMVEAIIAHEEQVLGTEGDDK